MITSWATNTMGPQSAIGVNQELRDRYHRPDSEPHPCSSSGRWTDQQVRTTLGFCPVWPSLLVTGGPAGCDHEQASGRALYFLSPSWHWPAGVLELLGRASWIHHHCCGRHLMGSASPGRLWVTAFLSQTLLHTSVSLRQKSAKFACILKPAQSTQSI